MSTVIGPQKGPQWQFLSTSADICIYGGAAGGGKSYGLLLTPLRHMNVPGFGCTIFRKNFNQIFAQGGLWDSATSIYGQLPNASPSLSSSEWRFTGKDGTVLSKVSFKHIERDSELPDWQGSQICELCCEENTPVLMSDMSYKAVKDIEIGDMVATLQGPRTVTHKGIRKLKPCVTIKTKCGEQVCTTDHKVLTEFGWFSYEDLTCSKKSRVEISGVVLCEGVESRHFQLEYPHPYTGETLKSEAGNIDISYNNVLFTPAGECYVIDVTVDECNHYITACGLVNKNCFDELTHFCLHPDTEVLTCDGWKNITEVKVGDYVPSRSEFGEIELKKVLDTPSFDFDGEMLGVYQRKGISTVMTPNHKIPVMSQADRSNGKQHRFVTAEHLLKRRELIARSGEWNSGKEYESMVFPLPSGRGIGTNANITHEIPMDDWLELLGWYLSDGSSFLATKYRGGTSPCVSIRQTKSVKSLDALMSRLPWRVKPDGDGGYRIFSRQLYEVLHPMGNLYEKRIPRYVFTLSKRQQEILFDAFMKGDGYKTSHGGYQVGLANEGLIDDLQEMAVYLGRIATKGHVVTKSGFNVYSLTVQKESRRQFSIVKPGSVEKIPYSGKVYCLTVEDNHTFMIRHRNRISWTGNSEKTFFYMLSRNRSTCGVTPFVRATCNPDADSWVAKFIEWWIDQDTGYPIPERSGQIRWMIRRDGQLYWASTKEALWREFNLVSQEELAEPKSVTFIASSIYDNKALLEANPQYLANLKSLPEVERERLLGGNWKIKSAAGLFFKREQCGEILEIIPRDVIRWVRCWDLAATSEDESGNAAYTAGVLIGKRRNGRYLVADVINKRMKAADVRKTILLTAQSDRAKYRKVTVRIPQDPGQAGKEQAQTYIQMLAGFSAKAVTESGSKTSRAEPIAAQWQAGNVDIVYGDWNEPFLAQLESFPEGKYKDMVDALANGFTELEARSAFNIGSLIN